MTHASKPITRARRLRAEASDAERLLWKSLRDRRLAGVKFRRQHPIGPYVVDFACVARKLVIEADGLSHTIDDQAAFDAARTAWLEGEGWRVLRFDDRVIKSDPSGAVSVILQALQEGG